jgi:hypothetical protein
MWLELSWQGIHFDVIISGSPSTSITQSVVQDYKFLMQVKTIIYTNSKKQAICAIPNAMENVIQQIPDSGEVIPLTGDDGLQFKDFTMHAFANDNESRDEEVGGNGGPISLLPNLTIMLATKVVDRDVSSKLCQQSYCYGLVPLMYSLVQEMGCVDRNPLEGPGDIQYEVHITFPCLMMLYLRIMQHSDPSKRDIQLLIMFDILKLVVIPN